MFGAITIRSLLTIVVVKLLEIPGLLLAGGVLLIWIAYKLIVGEKDQRDVKSIRTFFQPSERLLLPI